METVPANSVLMTPARWAAITRAAGSWATIMKADQSNAVNLRGVFDNVDTRQQLDTGIAAGTPIFELLTADITDPETGAVIYGNGDLLHMDGRDWKIYGKPLTDPVAGVTTLTLARTPL
jgi:hypothetical protein